MKPPTAFFEVLLPNSSPPPPLLSSHVGLLSARLGKLALPGRSEVETPNFLVSTSRGVVPHLTPDNVRRHVDVGGALLALEDFIERRTDFPAATTPTTPVCPSPLHAFTAMPARLPTVLAPRRCPPVAAPGGNTVGTLSVFTSTGFRPLSVSEYAAATRSLRPDMVVGIADMGSMGTTSKRRIKAVERTQEWLDKLLTALAAEEAADGKSGQPVKSDKSDESDELGNTTNTGPNLASKPAVFAPILDTSYPLQWEYITNLETDLAHAISGLAFHDVEILSDLASHPSLLSLPRLSLDPPTSPHQLLRQISLGVDLFTIPLINTVSDAGIALSFVFPAPEASTLAQFDNRAENENSAAVISAPTTPGRLPLGRDMWTPDNRASLEPLDASCLCYACSRHHGAFVHHLLATKEMLGWTLLQTHNYHIMTAFLAGVRRVLAREGGAEAFEVERRRFVAMYEADIPAGTGVRPRARGYQFKSEASQVKLNQAPWQKLEPEKGDEPRRLGR